MGHAQVKFCYGCGAYGVAEETREDDPKATHFGKQGWWPAPWDTQEVEWPGDVRYDPWTGGPVTGIETTGYLRMEDWQIYTAMSEEERRFGQPHFGHREDDPEFIQDSDPGDEQPTEE